VSARRTRQALLLALVLASPAFVLPLFAGPGAVIGHVDSDVYTAIWDVDYVGDSLAGGRLPLTTDRVAFPGGSLFPSKPVLALVASALRPVFGLTTGYNLAVWLFLALGIFGMFLLAAELTGSGAGGVVAAVGFGLSPFALAYAVGSGAPELLGLGFLPGAFFFWRRGGWGGAAAAGGLLGVAMASSAYVALMAALATGAWLVAHWLANRGEKAGPVRFGPAVLALAIAAMVALPPTLALLKTLAADDSVIPTARFAELSPQPPFMDYAPGAPSYYAAGLLDLVRPHVTPVAEGSLFAKTVTMTWGLLALAMAGAWLAWRRAWPWLAAAGVFALVAVGPYLLVTQHLGLAWPANPFYLAAYYGAPWFGDFLEPFRLAQVAQLFVALAAAWGGTRLVERFGRRGAWLVLALVAATLVETAWLAGPYLHPAALAHVPASTEAVTAARASSGAIVELPFFDPARPSLMRRDRFGNQIAHGRPIIDELVGFLPPLTMSNALVARLLAIEGGGDTTAEATSVSSAATELAAGGVGALVIDHCLYAQRDVGSVDRLWDVLAEAELSIRPFGKCVWLVELPQ
jgi:hypothetical protein